MFRSDQSTIAATNRRNSNVESTPGYPARRSAMAFLFPVPHGMGRFWRLCAPICMEFIFSFPAGQARRVSCVNGEMADPRPLRDPLRDPPGTIRFGRSDTGPRHRTGSGGAVQYSHRGRPCAYPPGQPPWAGPFIRGAHIAFAGFCSGIWKPFMHGRIPARSHMT